MNKPFPTEEQVNRFKGTLVSLGGKSGNGPMIRKLGWSEEDYNWIKANLISEGVIRTGRGRGGSIYLVNSTNSPGVVSSSYVVEESVNVKKTSNKEDPEDPEEINVEEVKSRYVALSGNLENFKPGMRVVRPRFDLYSSDNAWRNLKHYIVDRVERDQVFVRVAQSKESMSYAARPVGFYQRA